MKLQTVILAPFAIVGVFVACIVPQLLTNRAGFLHVVLIALAAAAGVWLAAMVFNFSVFLPVYWLLGRKTKSTVTEKVSRRS